MVGPVVVVTSAVVGAVVDAPVVVGVLDMVVSAAVAVVGATPRASCSVSATAAPAIDPASLKQ
ncbi:hypothetical protein EN35_04415 [Rhodococcus qingshengii]|nr:hypothetical protein EN35_04415 [Rhodococcus qingshengii]